MSEQTTIPDVPPVGRLKRLRAVLPAAERIIGHAKEIELYLGPADSGRSVHPDDIRALGVQRRALRKRLDALGVPLKRARGVEDFPPDTQRAARAHAAVAEALEIAGSAIIAVGAAERAAIPRRGSS